jgi:hypothetical protein
MRGSGWKNEEFSRQDAKPQRKFGKILAPLRLGASIILMIFDNNSSWMDETK